MARNPFYYVGLEEGLQYGESLRNKVAQQFMEFRRLNPEATADELRGFLSMAGGMSPYTGEAFTKDIGLAQIAEANAKTKAKREFEEQMLKTAKENEIINAMTSNLSEAYVNTGDMDAAIAQVKGRYNNDPHYAQLFDNFLTPEAKKAIQAKADMGVYGLLREAEGLGYTGQPFETAPLPPLYRNSSALKSAWQSGVDRLKREKEDRDYTASERKKKEDLESQAYAKMVVDQGLTYEEAMKYPGMTADQLVRIRPFIQTYLTNRSKRTYDESIAKAPEVAAERGKKQFEALGLEDWVKSPEGKKNTDLVVAARNIALNYHLEPEQLARLSAAAMNPAMRGKGKQTTLEKMMASVFGGSRPPTIVDAYKAEQSEILDRAQPRSFAETLANQDEYADALVKGLTARYNSIAKMTDHDAAGQGFRAFDKDINTRIARLREEYSALKATDFAPSGDAEQENVAREAHLAHQIAALTNLQRQANENWQRLMPQPKAAEAPTSPLGAPNPADDQAARAKRYEEEKAYLANYDRAYPRGGFTQGSLRAAVARQYVEAYEREQRGEDLMAPRATKSGLENVRRRIVAQIQMARANGSAKTYIAVLERQLKQVDAELAAR